MSIFESVLKEHKLSTSNQSICSETLSKGGEFLKDGVNQNILMSQLFLKSV